MLLVGQKLKDKILTQHIVNEQNFDNTCIKLSLGEIITRIQPDLSIQTLELGTVIPESCIYKSNIKDSALTLKPHEAILGMSDEFIRMPPDCFGLLQTKGSLARLMVSLHFSDGQIDPGFQGHVTFEIYNASDFYVKINYQSFVGNLYIFSTDGDAVPYCGKYAGSNEPTIQIP